MIRPYQELRSGQRVDLAAAVPLPAPFSVFLEPTNVCNFRCEVCPESFPDYKARAGYYQRMPTDLYLKALSELKAWDKLKVLRFYCLGEPLLHPKLPEMIRMAYEAGVAERLELTTNASLIDEKIAGRLVRPGLHCLRVSVYAATDEGYRLSTGTRYTAREIRENVATLRRVRDSLGLLTPVLIAKCFAESEAGAADFQRDYLGIADEVGFDSLHNWSGLDARSPSNGVRAHARQKEVCPHPFYTLLIKANGDVSVCCVDWSGQLVVGDLHTSTLRDIWEGPVLRALQTKHLLRERSQLPACRDCEFFAGLPDDLDHLSADEFLSRPPLYSRASRRV